MGMKKKQMVDEYKWNVVKEAMSGIKVSYLARKHEVSPRTIYLWIQEYKDKYGDDIYLSVEERESESKRLAELEGKYEQAMKLLGEKELTIEILTELVKKRNPAYRRDSK